MLKRLLEENKEMLNTVYNEAQARHTAGNEMSKFNGKFKIKTGTTVSLTKGTFDLNGCIVKSFVISGTCAQDYTSVVRLQDTYGVGERHCIIKQDARRTKDFIKALAVRSGLVVSVVN